MGGALNQIEGRRLFMLHPSVLKGDTKPLLGISTSSMIGSINMVACVRLAKISTARANSSVTGRRTQAAIFVLAMVIVMKVVGIERIKLFRNFIFHKSIVIFTGYQHLRLLFFLILT
jgi:hypothetical protein